MRERVTERKGDTLSGPPNWSLRRRPKDKVEPASKNGCLFEGAWIHFVIGCDIWVCAYSFEAAVVGHPGGSDLIT